MEILRLPSPPRIHTSARPTRTEEGHPPEGLVERNILNPAPGLCAYCLRFSLG